MSFSRSACLNSRPVIWSVTTVNKLRSGCASCYGYSLFLETCIFFMGEGCTLTANPRYRTGTSNNSNYFNLDGIKMGSCFSKAASTESRRIRKVQAAKIVPPGQDFLQTGKVIWLINVIYYHKAFFFFLNQVCGKTVEKILTPAATVRAAGKRKRIPLLREGFWEIVSERKGWIAEHSIKAGQIGVLEKTEFPEGELVELHSSGEIMAVCGRDEPYDVPHAPESKRICLHICQHDSPRLRRPPHRPPPCSRSRFKRWAENWQYNRRLMSLTC